MSLPSGPALLPALPPDTPSRRLTALRRKLAVLGTVVALGAVVAGVCVAAGSEIEGIRFDDAARVGGKTLQLNGTGLRAVFIVKGYVAGLYLPEKARNAAVVLGDRGPKRLQIRVLREVEPDDIIKALGSGIRRNHTDAQLQSLADRLGQLDRTIVEVGTAHKGDVINLDFSPDTGTVVAINGTPRGRPIPGEDLYQAVLRAFLGDRPVDADLKRGLLGG
jgi:hypothetical protein